MPTEEKNKVYCVVCNKYGHPASYKGCEIYKQLQQKLRLKKKKTLLENRSNNINSFTNPEVSFANALRGDQNVNFNTNTLKENINNDFFIELKNMIININVQITNLQK